MIGTLFSYALWNLSGNLKHKDLMGQVVSSQAYMDDPNDVTNNDPEETIVQDD